MEKKTILVVDDDALFRTFVRGILTEEGYHVLEACHGEDALEVCKQNSFSIDLLFTDIVMPRMDGVELAEHVGKLMPLVKIIFTSGYSPLPPPQQEPKDGELNFIEKPCDSAYLIQKIAHALRDFEKT